jgi:hypothetical protein
VSLKPERSYHKWFEVGKMLSPRDSDVPPNIPNRKYMVMNV